MDSMNEKELKREIWAATGQLVGIFVSLLLAILMGVEVYRATGKTVWGFMAFFVLDALFSIDRQTRKLAERQTKE